MQGFAFVPEEDRWALAFHAGRFAFPDVAEGERIWNEHESVRRLLPNMAALAAIAPAALPDKIGEERAHAVTAWLRANPRRVVTADGSGPPAKVRYTLTQSLAAHPHGDSHEAEEERENVARRKR